MMPEGLARGEFIGKKVVAKKEGLEGEIIDETKNTFTIRTKKGDKKSVKENNTFEFTIDDLKVAIDGNTINSRPEDRTKGAH